MFGFLNQFRHIRSKHRTASQNTAAYCGHPVDIVKEIRAVWYHRQELMMPFLLPPPLPTENSTKIAG